MINIHILFSLLLLAPLTALQAYETEDSLKTSFGNSFSIGAAIPAAGLNDAELRLLYKHFSTITAENWMKPKYLQPSENSFHFAKSDALIAMVRSKGLTINGHTLIWHQQTPGWFFENKGKPADRDLVLDRLRKHIATVAGHFAGKVVSWDVVNEAIDPGQGYLRNSKWLTSIGEDYILEAFAAAYKADPTVELYYNDYDIELKTKREKALRLIRSLKARNAFITGVGIQGHWQLDKIPFKDIEDAIIAFHAEGMKVAITELDIDVIDRQTAGGNTGSRIQDRNDPFANGLPPEIQKRLAEQYAQLFSLFLKHSDKVSRVTFWGLHDGRSWLNYEWTEHLEKLPSKRTNHPLLWDRNLQPKKALSALLMLTSTNVLMPVPPGMLHAAEVQPATPGNDSGSAANLLQNPSFEKGAGDGAKGWRSRAWEGQKEARFSVETPGRTGERCVSIASDKGADAAWTTTVSVHPDAWYRLSGWIKTRKVRGATGALLHIQNMPDVWTTAVSGTRDWTHVETVFHSGAMTHLEINCLFGGWGSSTGQAWYEDVSMEPVAKPPEELRATVTIDTGAPSVRYSPMIFGGFLEHFNNQVYGGVFEPGSPLSDKKGFRQDVLAALKELNVPIVRWPGGCYVSGYRWEAGVGKERKTTDDMAWGVVEPNTFGTDEYVELCQILGWTPYICNNAGNGTVEEMGNWVAYCNGKLGTYAQRRKDNGYVEPRNVPIWSIGNENYWEQEIGYKPIEQWAPLVLEGAKMMKKADPTVQLTAAALPTREWTLPLLKAAGDYLDYISLHGYWIYHENKGLVHNMPDYLTCIMHSESPEKKISDFIGILEESGYRGRIKIAFDEWNLRAWYHPGFPRKTLQDYNDPEVKRLVAAREDNEIASQYTMADALFSASFFNACLRHAEDVGMANIAPIVNTRGPLFVHPKGIVRRTHFHAMAMYANELQPRVAKWSLEAGDLRHGGQRIKVLDGIATVDEAGKQWAIALVNRHPAKAVDCTVKMKDSMLDGEYEALVLAGDSPEAFNDMENPNRVTPQKTTLTFQKGVVSLPPHSLTIVNVLLKERKEVHP